MPPRLVLGGRGGPTARGGLRAGRCADEGRGRGPRPRGVAGGLPPPPRRGLAPGRQGRDGQADRRERRHDPRPGREITGLVVIFRDVTDRKRAEEAAREADRRKDEFLATLAHELRNPLAPIRTGLQILRHTEGDNPAVEPLRAMMDRQAEHLARLVDDLMDVSRINHGTIELRKEVVGLASVVDQAVAANRPAIDERGHELSVGVPDGEERLEADPTRLEQVLANLLTNAAKYTDPGGHIRLDARREGDEVVIRVGDTGIGIAPEMLPKVFDMFVQIERRLDRSQGGLGIGLSLVKSLVEMHGGAIAATARGRARAASSSSASPRSRPRPGDPRGPAHRPPARPRTSRDARRILVVDDNQDAADSLARYLTRVMGHGSRSPTTGRRRWTSPGGSGPMSCSSTSACRG